MTLPDYMKVFRERVRLVALVVLTFLGLAVVVVLLRPAQFTSSISFYVSSQTGRDASQANQGAELSQGRVISYVEIATGPRVLNEVSRRINPPATLATLSKQVVATSKEDSVVIDVAASDPSPTRAAEIANAIGAVFPGVIAELERPTDPAGSPATALRIIQPAVPSYTSSAVSPFAIVAGGLILGVLFAGTAAVVVNSFDKSLKSVADLQNAANRPVLASVPRSNSTKIVTDGSEWSQFSEAIRSLRTNLQFADVDNPPKIIGLTSPSSGEGKSTVAIALARSAAAAGSRVLLIEADLRRPVIADRLSIERSIGLTTVLIGKMSAESAVQSAGNGIDVLTSGALPPNPSELLSSQQMGHLLRQVTTKYDCIFIDTAPVLPVADTVGLSTLVDGMILAGRWSRTDTSDVERACEALRITGCRLIGTILTLSPEERRDGYSNYYKQAVGHERIVDDGNAATRVLAREDSNRPSPGPRGNSREATNHRQRR